MEAKTLEEKSLKISTLLQVVKDVNGVFFPQKEKKAEIIGKVIEKLEKELETY